MNTIEAKFSWEDRLGAIYKGVDSYRQKGMIRVWKIEGESNEDLLKRFSKEIKEKSRYFFKEDCKISKFKIS